MQRGARFAIFDVPFGAPCWAQRGRQRRYKINAFLFIFKMKGTLGAATKWIPKSNMCKICPENECFVRLPWELFGVHLGWSLFVCARCGCSSGALEKAKKCLNIMVWEICWGPVLGGPFGLSSPRKRSHAAWRSFCVLPERSHAAWRSYSFAEPLICVRAAFLNPLFL